MESTQGNASCSATTLLDVPLINGTTLSSMSSDGNPGYPAPDTA